MNYYTLIAECLDIPNYGCRSCTCLNQTSYMLFFPFGLLVAGRSFPFAKASLARSSREQGLGEEYYPKNEGGDCSLNDMAA